MLCFCCSSSSLTSWRSRTTSASGSRRRAWWECPAKQVGNQKETHRFRRAFIDVLLSDYKTGRLECIISYFEKQDFVSVWFSSSAVEMLQHHRDFPVSVRRADQPARPYSCRHRLHDRSTDTPTPTTNTYKYV